MRPSVITAAASPRISQSLLSTTRRSFATTSRLRDTYGFIGLGQMGYPMAKNLRSKIPSSDKLFIHDVNESSTSKFVSELDGYDVQVAKNVREVAENADTIITVLPEPQHVQNVYHQMLSPTTLRTSAPNTSSRLFIDCSTIDPQTSSSVANATLSSGQGRFIDAPMSGGVVGATAGKLTFMIGASDDLVPHATSILSHMGARVIHLGPQTSGLKGKLANNYLLALNNIATAEAMNMGVSWGLDPVVLASMINTATGKCWPSEVNNPVPGVLPTAPASRGYQGGFGSALMLKDLRLAIQAANEAGITPRLGVQAEEMYVAVEKDPELKGKDFSVVYQYIRGKDGR